MLEFVNLFLLIHYVSCFNLDFPVIPMQLKRALRNAENQNDDYVAEIKQLKARINHNQTEKRSSSTSNDSVLLASQNERLTFELKEAQRTIKV